MQATIERAISLKQTLVDFVYDATDEVASALETYAAARGKKNSYGIKQQNLTVDLFTTEGKVGDKSPLDLFIESEALSPDDLEMIKRWSNNFVGLFEIQTIEADSYRLMNWLTAKTYRVYPHGGMSEKETARWQPGEIILTILAPLKADSDIYEWFFYSDRIIKGKLSQPKLAVAIGEFRDNYPEFLYADAPELLELAWDSVAVYHREFVDYFGTNKVILPGYKLNKKIAELQQKMSQQMLAEAGIDSDKSLSEVLSASGNEAEFGETAKDLGVDAKTIEGIVENKNKLSMVTPKVDLPPEIRNAESVTAFSHPRWGQSFLPNFDRFEATLSGEKQDGDCQAAIAKYLQQPEANYYVWQRLGEKHAPSLTKVLAEYTQQAGFDLDTDLDKLLLEYGKNSTPELPAIASVPKHLNDLFESAVAQVQKTRSKAKKSKKKGFSSN